MTTPARSNVPDEHATLVNQLRANMYDALQDDYRLTTREADVATSNFLADWQSGPAFPAVPHTAVADAYARWAATADPLLLAEREAEQRVAGIEFDIADAKSHLDIEEQGSSLALSNAYLQLGAATIKLDEAMSARRASGPVEPEPNPPTRVASVAASDHHAVILDGATDDQAVRNDQDQFGASNTAGPVTYTPRQVLETTIFDRLVDDYDIDIPTASTAADAFIRDRGDKIPAEYLDYTDADRLAEIVDDAHRTHIGGQGQVISGGDQSIPTSETVDNTAYLDGAVAALTDIAVPHPGKPIGDNASAWDQVAPPDSLEEDLQPDRVRYRPAPHPDAVVIEAGFGSTTITVTRREQPGHRTRYWFRQDDPIDPFRQGPLVGTDPLHFGVIASGDRFGHVDRSDLYAELGRQVRNHLIGMADAVAAQRQTLADREATKIAATQVVTDHGFRRSPERSL